MCVCVCVCVREREREREDIYIYIYIALSLFASLCFLSHCLSLLYSLSLNASLNKGKHLLSVRRCITLHETSADCLCACASVTTCEQTLRCLSERLILGRIITLKYARLVNNLKLLAKHSCRAVTSGVSFLTTTWRFQQCNFYSRNFIKYLFFLFFSFFHFISKKKNRALDIVSRLKSSFFSI